ncbi:MAG: glycosyltransferase [Verrucomicrobiota bacterium]
MKIFEKPARSNIKLAAFFPNFNHRQYLDQALGAMLKQAQFLDHLLIVDDASTDGSQDYIREAVRKSPKNVDAIFKPVNKGIFDSHRIASERIQADFFYSASSDDWILPGFVEKCRRALESYPEAGLCCTNRLVYIEHEDRFYEDRLPIEGDARYISPDEFREIIQKVDRFIFPSNSVWVNWKMLQSMGGFPPQLQWHTDWFTYLALALRKGFYYIPENLTVFRFLKSSMSGAGMHQLRNQRKIFGQCLDTLRKKDFQDVRPAFRNPSLLAISKISRSIFFMQALKKPSRWWFLSRKLAHAIYADLWRPFLFDTLWLLAGTFGASAFGFLKIRFLKWFGANIEGKPRIEPGIILEKPWNIHIQHGAWIKRGSHIRADERIVIGEHAIVESGAQLLAGYWDQTQTPVVWRTGTIHIAPQSLIEAGSVIYGNPHEKIHTT